MSSCRLRGPDGRSARRSLWYFHILLLTYLPLLLHLSLACLAFLSVGFPHLTHFGFLPIIYDVFGQLSASLSLYSLPPPHLSKGWIHPSYRKRFFLLSQVSMQISCLQMGCPKQQTVLCTKVGLPQLSSLALSSLIWLSSLAINLTIIFSITHLVEHI